MMKLLGHLLVYHFIDIIWQHYTNYLEGHQKQLLGGFGRSDLTCWCVLEWSLCYWQPFCFQGIPTVHIETLRNISILDHAQYYVPEEVGHASCFIIASCDFKIDRLVLIPEFQSSYQSHDTKKIKKTSASLDVHLLEDGGNTIASYLIVTCYCRHSPHAINQRTQLITWSFYVETTGLVLMSFRKVITRKVQLHGYDGYKLF